MGYGGRIMPAPAPDFLDAVVLTGGGTGGHYYPAIALAEGIRSRWSDRPIAFVGALRGIEARELPGTAWPHLLQDVEGFLGRSPMRAARSGWKLWRAVAQLKRAWRQARPAVVIGTGGYGAAPALQAARSLRIPYFLHESNAAPGALVRLVAPKARRVWCGMAAVLPLLPGADCRVVGTPVREAFLRPFRDTGSLASPFRLLILGGSGGARAVNDALLALAPKVLDRNPAWEILHQVGPQEFRRLEDVTRHERHELVPYIPDMDQAMESAALVISRAGASTCAELRAAGRGALLVPLPTSAHDHQTRNAQALVADGRAVLVRQTDGLAQDLEAALTPLLADASARQSLSKPPEQNRAVALCLEDLEPYLG